MVSGVGVLGQQGLNLGLAFLGISDWGTAGHLPPPTSKQCLGRSTCHSSNKGCNCWISRNSQDFLSWCKAPLGKLGSLSPTV